ncbi:MAG: pyridoxamine kinase [Clostridia bacterium]|nr:pyridoxamine kinase [Clostridia bacterium]
MSNEYKRILTIQDISCVGQCSLTVALPIISACGIETAVLPSAVLSTHTAGFDGFTFRDLTGDMGKICDHWKRVNIKFDGFYTGYLGSSEQIDYCLRIFEETAADGAVVIVDPAMADNGRLYVGFDMAFVESMKRLVARADIVLPNITEACLLTGMEYKTEYDAMYIREITKRLLDLGAKNVVLTGIGFEKGFTGVWFENREKADYYRHEQLPGGCHGTGDVYASAFAGALMRGKGIFEAASIAADYTVECIKNTQGDSSHWYGVKFEPVLPKLIGRLG